MTFCPQCRKPVAATDTFCTACGMQVVHTETPAAMAPAQVAPAKRPSGVTIIGGVMIVLGAFLLLVFLGGLYLSGSDAEGWSEVARQSAEQVGMDQAEVEPILRGMLVGGSIAAVVAIVAGIGALIARRWAWWLMIAFMLLNGIGSILQIPTATGILGIVVSALVIWYFLRPEVKAYFSA